MDLTKESMMDKYRMQELITEQTEKIKRKKPALSSLDLNYFELPQGTYMARLKAKVKQKTIFLKSEDRCPESSIRKLFNMLTRILNQKKSKGRIRLVFNQEEAV